MPEVAPQAEAPDTPTDNKPTDNKAGFGCLALIGLAFVAALVHASSGDKPDPISSPSPRASATSAPATSSSGVDLWQGIGKPIPGAAAYDATAGLEQRWGLQFKTKVILEDRAQMIPGGLSKEATTIDPDTGAELVASIRTDEQNHVRLFNCSVTGDLSPAADLLGFCATLPYDGAQPAQARAWVTSVLPSVQQAHPLTRTFGGVQFEVSGATPTSGQGARFLQITRPA